MGKWYHPLPTASGFTETGKASWYGKKFHGRLTANGERYDMYGITAAHKTLPLGTVVRVRNLDNGRTLDIRLNDRGPFVEGRIIDLSYGAAKSLGVVGPGTANVRLTALGKPTAASDGSSTPTYQAVDYTRGNFTFQVGAFKDPANAERLKQRLSASYQNVHVKAYFHEVHGTLHGVRLGLAKTLEQAAEYKQILRQKGFNGAFTIAE
jgi:rare lipoprotein A